MMKATNCSHIEDHTLILKIEKHSCQTEIKTINQEHSRLFFKLKMSHDSKF
jgi:hypothetical protein